MILDTAGDLNFDQNVFLHIHITSEKSGVYRDICQSFGHAMYITRSPSKRLRNSNEPGAV